MTLRSDTRPHPPRHEATLRALVQRLTGYTRHRGSCARNVCQHAPMPAGHASCGRAADHDIHYSGTVDAHAFVAGGACSCGLTDTIADLLLGPAPPDDPQPADDHGAPVDNSLGAVLLSEVQQRIATGELRVVALGTLAGLGITDGCVGTTVATIGPSGCVALLMELRKDWPRP